MKRLLLLLLAVLLVAPVMATSLNFQNPTDNQTHLVNYKYGTGVNSHSQRWIESTSGGNNYVVFNLDTGTFTAGGGTYYTLPSASSSTYAASTLIYRGDDSCFGAQSVVFLDASRNYISRKDFAGAYYEEGSLASGTRLEVRIAGGKAHFYVNGAYNSNISMAVAPSFIGFGVYSPTGISGTCSGGMDNVQWDDYVYGQTENKVILGLPESDDDKFVIMQDIINSANDGLYNTTSGTVADSNNMIATWGRGNSTTDFLPPSADNVSINLVRYGNDAVIYDTKYTGTAYRGTLTFDIKTKLIDANAPDGYYALTIPGSGAYSNLILKKSNGATVQFNAESYSIGDSGTISTVINGSYWDSDYTYKLDIVDVFGEVKQSTPITSTPITIDQEWTTDYTQGYYYAWLIATSVATGQEYLLGSDITTLSAEIKVYGYANADQTALPVANVTMNWSQGTSSRYNLTTNATGYYETSAIWLTGSSIGANISATGYENQWWNATVTNAHSIFVNITLNTTSKNFTDIALGGTDKESLYHRPISAKYERIYNTTYSEEWYVQTNNAGAWWIDNNATPAYYNAKGSGGGISEGRATDGAAAVLNPHTQAILTNGRYYCVESYKIGYVNTTTCRTVSGS